MDDERRDFFISYNHRDTEWATWLAGLLEDNGYSVFIQEWDFRPGSNFVNEMEQATRRADRTIAVVSPNYLESSFVRPEWQAAFAQDPEGTARRLVPIVVARTDLAGLLAQVVHVNVVGLNESDASQKILAALVPGRSKPLARPAFPGPSGDDASDGTRPDRSVPTPVTAEPVVWTPADPALSAEWRTEIVPGNTSTPAILELHLIPAEPIRAEATRLAAFEEELAVVGRSRGIFSSTGELLVNRDAHRTIVQAVPVRGTGHAGLAVTRSGVRSAWIELPHDGLGSVLNEHDVTARIQSLLTTLLGLDIAESASYGIAIAIDPVSLLSVTDVDVVGRRSNATMTFMSRSSIRVLADDTISMSAIQGKSESIARELAARLMSHVNG